MNVLIDTRKLTATRYEVHEIPEEILIDILERLSLKPLARFKCVSRQWKQLISNTITVINHPKLLICSPLDTARFIFHSLDHKATLERVTVLRVGSPIIRSSCHGLLLIQVDSDAYYSDLFVWNPLTNFFRKVYTCYKYLCQTNDLANLCFDISSKEYKIVLVKNHYIHSSWGHHFDVVTCGTSNHKRVYIPFSSCSFQSGTFFRECVHWICKRGLINHIVGYEPSTSTLVEVPMPQPKSVVSNNVIGLGVLDGCLCMTRLCDHTCHLEFLAMKEYKNGHSWDIMYVISHTYRFYHGFTVEPLFITKEGEVIVMRISNGQKSVRAYNTYGRFLKEITTPDSDNISAVLYEESWFSPTSYNWEQFPPKTYKMWTYLDIFEENFGYE